MAKKAYAQELSVVTKSSKEILDNFKRGVFLEGRTGHSIDDLRRRASVDRLQFSSGILKGAREELKRTAPSYRLIVSRSYYSMYHAVRAVVYLQHGGDDHQEHSKLPGNLPGDFDDRLKWENELKAARLARNEADYEPYPRNEGMLKASAMKTYESAKLLQPIARAYLRRKGCPI